MELLVVLAILGLLMSLVGPQVLNQLGGAKTKTAAIQIKDLEHRFLELIDNVLRGRDAIQPRGEWPLPGRLHHAAAGAGGRHPGRRGTARGRTGGGLCARRYTG